MTQVSYFRCAKCGEIVSISFNSYAADDEDSVRELEAAEKCFSCGYTPFRVREVLASRPIDSALSDWPE